MTNVSWNLFRLNLKPRQQSWSYVYRQPRLAFSQLASKAPGQSHGLLSARLAKPSYSFVRSFVPSLKSASGASLGRWALAAGGVGLAATVVGFGYLKFRATSGGGGGVDESSLPPEALELLKSLKEGLLGLLISQAHCLSDTKDERAPQKEGAAKKKGKRTAHYEETIGDSKEEDKASAEAESGKKKNKTKDDMASFDYGEFFRLIYNEKYYFIAAVASAFVVAMLNISIPQDLGKLINGVYDMLKSEVKDYYQTLYKPSMDLIKLYLAQSVFTFSYIYLLGIIGENIAANLKQRVFAKIIQQDIAFYDRTRSGELIDRLTSDVQEFKSSFKMCISQGLRSMTQIIGCCASLYFISPKLTLITSLVLPLAVLIGAFFGSILRTYSKMAQAQVAKSTAVADEAVNNVRTVRAFAMEDAEIEMFSEEINKARDYNVRLSFGIAIFQGLSNLFINGIVLGVLYAGGSMLVNNEINAGQMMAYLAATQMIQRSFTQLSILFGQVIRGMSSGGRVFEYLKFSPSIPVEDVGKKVDHLSGNITFKKVSFSYSNRKDNKVLDSFDLDVKPGQVVAIVGHSGSGKSTVCSLLERFYDVDSGSIEIDGVNIKDLSPFWLRRNAIGYISQEPILFATSIAENIRYGKPEATNEEIENAAKLANAHEFISSFRNSYNTVVGERGTTLSGGQKQRIAIARALLKKPKILILDEATSALDSKSERMVQETINNVIKGHTVIIVAHRLSTIKNADKIVVLNNGKIIEVGTHDELMRLKNGHYFSLFNLQTSHQNPDASS